MTQLAPPIAELALSGSYRRGQELAPKAYKPEIEPTFRANATEVLRKLEFAFVGALSPGGWPMGTPVRFASATDEGERPILYFQVDEGAPVATNIQGNPRVTLEAHYAVSFEERRQTRAVQMQGLATLVEDEAEAGAALSAIKTKYAEKTDFEEVECGRIVRVDILSLIFFYPMGRPQWGYIDYLVSPPRGA